MDVYRKRRLIFAWLLAAMMIGLGAIPFFVSIDQSESSSVSSEVLSEAKLNSELASEAVEELEVKGRAPKTGYARDEFGSGWATIDGCDSRNRILQVSLTEIEVAEDGCIVLSGVLQDPYTGEEIQFLRGRKTSDAVQIDHVVALSDSWQKGAQALDFSERVVFANDPLNLLAVDGPANQQKGDSDTASWLPPNRSFRCQYVARQIAVKQKYELWITEAEKATMKRVLNGCGEQRLPLEN